MNLKIMSQINTSIGTQVSDAYVTVDANTDHIMSSGQVFCTLNVYTDATAWSKKYDTLCPVILDGNANIESRISTVMITLTEQEVVAANLPLTIYQKTADKLSADYGWTVIIEN